VRLKTFRAFTLAEALDAVHEDLGSEAAILHTRTFKRGGFLGLGGREVVEVIASERRPETSILPALAGTGTDGGDSASNPDSPEIPNARSVASARARAAYGAVGDVRPAAISDDSAPVSSGSLEVDRDRTRKLAQAMAIRLERQQAARNAAGVQGPDDLIGGAEPSMPVDSTSEPSAFQPISFDAPARVTPEQATARRSERFVIGEGGVLLPEREASSVLPESPPRVVALDSERLVADPGTGIPTVAPERHPAVEMTPTPAIPTPAIPTPAIPTPAIPTPAIPTPAIPTPAIPELQAKPQATPEAEPQVAVAATELDAIRRTVGRVLVDGGVLGDRDAETAVLDDVARGGDGRDLLASAYASLVAQELSRDLADRVVAAIESRLDRDARHDSARVREAMLAEIADLVPTEESLESTRPRDGRPRTIAFVGPTGVGKTTTLAKIAATLVLRDKLRVALVTADTYRISAVDQLRTYAEILGATLEVAGDPTAMREAIARCTDVDAILVDTPGRSQNDVDRLAELRAIVDAARPHETHLVLSGTASERVLLREAEAFSSLGPDRVVLTKLDEAVAFGMLVSVVRRIGRRISWVTTGQEVPRDIERATGSRLADLVLGGAVRS
jgi:flagellar biosynthesis protein FlhF